MRARGGWALVFLLTAACSGGGGGTPQQASPVAETLAERIVTPRFRVHAGLAPDAVVREIADLLESEFPRVTADLGVTGVRPVRVMVWQDASSFGDEMLRHLGGRYASSGYVTGPDELRVLVVPGVARNAAHEFCHVASLWLNPTFGNNPRWLWESVALYESGERVDPRSLPYLLRGEFPTLAALNADPNASRQVYELGYLLGELVVARFGREGLLRMIQSNGDTAGSLGLATAAFEAEWRAFVRARYFS